MTYKAAMVLQYYELCRSHAVLAPFIVVRIPEDFLIIFRSNEYNPWILKELRLGKLAKSESLRWGTCGIRGRVENMLVSYEHL